MKIVKVPLLFLCTTILVSVIETQIIERPNVLFIILDDFRPAIKNGYGDENAITPNIDRLVQDGYYFANVFAQQALCAPSRNSMLTGRRPDTVRLYDFYSYWRQTAGNFTTLPQYFKQNGYHTHSVGKVFHPGASSNFTDDYPHSWSEPTYHPSTDEFSNASVCIDPEDGGRMKRNLLCPVVPEMQPLHSLPDIQSTEEAKRFLQEHRNGDPYFLAVGYRKPHIPFRIPFKYLDLHSKSKFTTLDLDYPPYGLPNVAWSSFLDVRNRDDFTRLNVSFPFGRVPEDFKLRIRQHYYAAVTYVDDLIGQLLKDVDRSKTIVALTGDHGWALGEHGQWAKYSNYDVAVRVPLIINLPDAFSDSIDKRRIDNVVELLDLFPTLVDLAGLPTVQRCDEQRPHKPQTCVEGKSLYSLLQRNRSSSSIESDEWIAYSQYPRPGPYPTLVPNSDEPKLKYIKIMGYSMRTERFRYTAWIKFNPLIFKRDWTTLYGEELYDHAIDPKENMNLIDREPLSSIRNVLQTKLKEKFP
ncbi:iduronate 2-sulfatase [Anopheles ziemanni]|uniref:iduronate 2-sulfatase n=1 Tax=Anopheles coustani TaxID=139045 RepID=UPI00265B57ED|nr:iduronate 2-sulfatase [Anopheles coustani]XP_058166491.1 iduronate 2-sulfatase [Anopheles ziemanni]